MDSIVAKVSRLLAVLKKLRGSLSREALSVFYVLYTRPQIEYASVVAWSNLTGTLNDKLERLQRKAAKIILGFGLYDKVRRPPLAELPGGKPPRLSRPARQRR